MRKQINCLTICLALGSCNSPKALVSKPPAHEKPAVAFTQPVTSVCFFGVDDSSAAFQKHKNEIHTVNQYFGPVYDNFPVFNIGDANIVAYSNTSGQTYFYRPRAKRKYGMVVSNGKDKPVVVYEPEHYLSEIKKHLRISSADDIVPKTKAVNDELSYSAQMERILQSDYKPDKTYTHLLVKNGNTIHYPKRTTGPCDCRERFFEIYSDSSLRQKIGIAYHYQYNDLGQLIQLESFSNGQSQGITRYGINAQGLIQQMSSGNEEDGSVVKFIYQPDRYYAISMEQGKPVSYETFFLNEKKQCIRRLTHRPDKSLVWDIRYRYDTKDRIIKEEQQDKETVYEYRNDSDSMYAASSSYSLAPRKRNSRHEVKSEKNKQIFTGTDDNGLQTFRSVTITEAGCATKTFSYDKDNRLTSVAVARCQ